MAAGRTSIKKYWPILLLAAAVAERAHAPLIHGAHASNGQTNGGHSSAPSVNTPHDQKNKAGPDLQIPPNPDPIDPEAIKKKLTEIDRARYEKPQQPWDLFPLDPTPDPSPDPSPHQSPSTDTVTLIPAVDPDRWSGIINNSDISGGGGGGQSGPGYTQPPDSIVYNPNSGGRGDIAFPENPVAPTDPTDPQQHNPVAVTGLAPVPEPAMMSVLLAGWMLVRRPGARETMNDQNTPSRF